MDLGSYVEFLRNLFELIPFNVFDYVVIFTLIVYALEDASFGILAAGISLLSTLFAFLLGLLLYHPVSDFIVKTFSLPKGISDAVAFLLVTVISFVVISTALSTLRKKYLIFKFPKKLDFIGGALSGGLSFFFIASFAVALLLSFPVSDVIKDSVRNSVTGRFLFTRTHNIENVVRTVFGGAINDTINFLTINPSSTGSISLNFTTKQYELDEKAEAEMLRIVNIERKKQGLPGLVADEELREVSREHARDMLERGYFSHYTPEGLSPFDRLAIAGVSYQYAGENLAFAPDVEIAMDGLMKSTGHRENILSPNFSGAGIGVMDAGIFGKMFVQMFRD